MKLYKKKEERSRTYLRHKRSLQSKLDSLLPLDGSTTGFLHWISLDGGRWMDSPELQHNNRWMEAGGALDGFIAGVNPDQVGFAPAWTVQL